MYDDAYHTMKTHEAVSSELVKLQNNLRRVARALGCRVLLVDLNPALNPFNRVQLMLSDRLLIPCTPDCFSEGAMEYMKDELTSYRNDPMMLEVYRRLMMAGVQGIDRNSRVTGVKYIGHSFSLYRNRSGGNAAGAIETRMEFIDKVSRTIYNSIGISVEGVPRNGYSKVSNKRLRVCNFEDFTSAKQYIQPLGVPIPLASEELAKLGARYDGIRHRPTEEDRFMRWRQMTERAYNAVMRNTPYMNNEAERVTLCVIRNNVPIPANINSINNLLV